MADAIVQVHDMEREGAFRQDDRKVLTSPRRVEKIRQVLTKLPVPIILHFLNTNRIADFSKHLRGDGICIGELTTEQIKEKYDRDIPQTPGVLTVLLVENEGRKRLPFTPWMVLHRLSHVFFQNVSDRVDCALYPLSKNNHDLLRQVWKDFQRTFENIAACYEFINEIDCMLCRLPLAAVRLPFVYGTTAACRADNLFQFGEWLHECFAQRYMTGQISFNPAQDILIHGSFGMKADRTKKEVQKNLDFISARLTVAFDNMLMASVGSIRVL